MKARRTVMGRRQGSWSAAGGFVRLKVLVTLLVLAGIVYLAAKLVPPYWNYFAMFDPVKEAAMAISRRVPEAEVRAGLIARARATDVTLVEESVEIVQRGNFTVVRVNWEVPLDIRVYRRALRFHIEEAVPAP